MQLTVDSERVRNAADKCPTARDVLREIFPQAFEEIFNPTRFTIDILHGESTPTIALYYGSTMVLSISKHGLRRTSMALFTASQFPVAFISGLTGHRIALNE
jgi:hypothetical protein